jgi:predicted nucleotidyltransferase component of viral defense system
VRKGPIKDLAASVRQRLLDHARLTNRPFQEVLQYYAMERFLYRLSQSPHASNFVLKGALMLTVWKAPTSRPTKDIDFLARLDNSVNAVIPVVRDICKQKVEPDGLAFDVASVTGTAIKEDADYAGVRVTFQVTLQNARVSMQIDMGFGDVVTPAAVQANYPTILEFPAPRLLSYNRQTAVAEKFEAMVKLGELNSRMKDFYDIWLLSRQFDFDGALLAKAVARTFANRGTAVDPRPFALTAEFANKSSKQAQWAGFLRKSKLDNVPMDLAAVIEALNGFLSPVAAAVHAAASFEKFWQAPGPWS